MRAVEIDVQVTWDTSVLAADGSVGAWLATSEEIPGFALHGDTKEQLMERLALAFGRGVELYHKRARGGG